MGDNNMKLDLSAFEKALGQLEKSLAYLRSKHAANDADLRTQFRAAVIQAFEYTYELAVKMTRRQLERIVANPSELPEMAFKDMIRTAGKAGLVRDVKAFFDYREIRNITSHTYDEDKAEKVVSIMDDFMKDAGHLLKELKRRNDEAD
jgi:nucleotidyltransferase substrate binding protein (TIGR01987 family)